MYFPFMPKGNKSVKRGHRTKVGGEESRGTIQKSIRIPVELFEKVMGKIGKIKFSDHVRNLLEKDFK